MPRISVCTPGMIMNIEVNGEDAGNANFMPNKW